MGVDIYLLLTFFISFGFYFMVLEHDETYIDETEYFVDKFYHKKLKMSLDSVKRISTLHKDFVSNEVKEIL